MPRITHVKRAQQRYATVPVTDPETGQQVTVPVVNGRTGQPKTTKSGRAIVMRRTREDRSQPLPMPRCDAPACRVAPIQDGDRTINVGASYKHMSPKSGPYGGRTLYRHEVCPTWQVWEYSSSLSARLAQIDHEAREAASGGDLSSTDSALREAAEAVRGLAEEKREAAQNIEDGFQHETEQSAELNDQAEQLESWADELDAAADDLPSDDRPEEEVECDNCGGDGRVQDAEGSEVDCDECTDGYQDNQEAIDEFEAAIEEALSVLDNCPL